MSGSPRWKLRHHMAKDMPREYALIQGDLQGVFLNTYPKLQLLDLSPCWQSPPGSPVSRILEIDRGSDAYRPLAWLFSGKLAVQRSRWHIHDPSTWALVSTLDGKEPSPCGTMCAARNSEVRRVHVPSSSIDPWADYTRDGDDLSERSTEEYYGVTIRSTARAPFHAGSEVVVAAPGVWSFCWSGSDKLVAWCNELIYLCDVRAATAQPIVRHFWVISGVAVSPNGRWMVGQPTGKPVTLWTVEHEPKVLEIPDSGKRFLLVVTDDAVVCSHDLDRGRIDLWEASSRSWLDPLPAKSDVVAWAVTPDARRAVVVNPDGVGVWERS